MRVEHLMTREVVTVSPEAPLRDAAELLAEHHVAGLPVCAADGVVVGLLSEGDVVRVEQGMPHGKSRLALLFGRTNGDRAHARTVAEAMSAPAITIEPAADISEAARLMIARTVHRLPVVEGGRLVGILARADLVRAFCRPDEELERELVQDVLLDTLWIVPEQITVEVHGGVAHLAGELETRTEAQLAERVARRVPGIVEVVSDLTYRSDDLAGRTGPPPREAV